jgi:uncharacterized GH25 family protein
MLKWLILLVCLGTASLSFAQDTPLTLSGSVFDAAGHPGVGAEVIALAMDYDYELRIHRLVAVGGVSAAGDGTFRIALKMESPHSRRLFILVARKEGHGLAAAYRSPFDEGGVSRTLGKPAALAGTIVDEIDKPVAGAEVNAMLSFGKDAVTFLAPVDWLTVKSDANGRFVFRGLPADATVAFLVTAPGRAATLAGMAKSPWGPLEFRPGQEDIRIVLALEARIEGVVVDKTTRKAVAGMRLLALPHATDHIAMAAFTCASGADGAFKIGGLPAGKASVVSVMPSGNPADWVSATVQVTVDAGKTTRDVIVEAAKGGVLEVSVVDAKTGNALVDASVNGSANIMDSANYMYFTGPTGRDGVARFRLPPGRVTVFGAHVRRYLLPRERPEVVLGDGQSQRLEMRLAPAPRTAGIVRDPDGTPVAGAEVHAVSHGATTVRSDKEGKFTVVWEFVGTEDTSRSLMVRHVDRNLAAIIDLRLDNIPVEVKLEPAMRLQGRVVTREGRPLAKAYVEVRIEDDPAKSPLGDVATTYEDGAFDIRVVPFGKRYFVQASAEGYGGAEVALPANGPKQKVINLGDVKLELADQIISGIVVGPDGKPVPNAEVYVFDDKKGGGMRSAVSDAAGKFTVKGLCAGEVRVTVPSTGQLMQSAGPLSVQAGTTDLRLVLRGWGFGVDELDEKLRTSQEAE